MEQPVQCVIADQCIGGVHEANMCAKKFEINNVGVSLSVTPCWAYGSETMDMHPTMPKAIWGFNGTQRPGAVYLAATLAAHNQFGLPAFGIYGRDVQDLEDEIIPEDVKDKVAEFCKSRSCCCYDAKQILSRNRFGFYGYCRLYCHT
ncbi:MAG: hypothetical protein WKG06_33920 [Segetibacter sp.]